MSERHQARLSSLFAALPAVGIAFGLQLATGVIAWSVAVLCCDAMGVGPRSQMSWRLMGKVLTAAPMVVLLNGLLFLVILVLALPVLATVWAVRRHVSDAAARVLAAATLALGAEWILYRMEWFDVWRWGIPSARYWVTVVLPWGLSYCAAGFFMAGVVMRWGDPLAMSGATRQPVR